MPESQRADAVSSMVYEASARIRDPIYGCAGAICQLQKQVNDLQTQLAKAQAELVNMQFQQANLVALICMEMSQTNNANNNITITPHNIISSSSSSPDQSNVDDFISTPPHTTNLNFFEDNTSFNSLWEPLWT